MEKLSLRCFLLVWYGVLLNSVSEQFPLKKIAVLCTTFAVLAFFPTAFAEQHEFTNTLPNYLEIEQGDSIFLKNLTNSTINLRHTEGLFSSGEFYTNGTTYQTQSIAVKTLENGSFETTLELQEIGTHDIIVSYDGKSIGKFSQQVTEESVSEYAGVDILELRLSLLETLERILEIIFGK